MSARSRLFFCASAALPLLTGCASSHPEAGATASATPVVVETNNDASSPGPAPDHGTIDKSNDQIYNAEHAMDPGAATVSNARNQDIP